MQTPEKRNFLEGFAVTSCNLSLGYTITFFAVSKAIKATNELGVAAFDTHLVSLISLVLIPSQVENKNERHNSTGGAAGCVLKHGRSVLKRNVDTTQDVSSICSSPFQSSLTFVDTWSA